MAKNEHLTSMTRVACVYLLFCLLSFFHPRVIDVQIDARVDVPAPRDVTITPRAEIRAESVMIPLDRITAYNPVPRQTDGDPNVSSCGANQPKQIALSRDLFFNDDGQKHLCGVRATVITHDGHVFHNYVIWDTMNPVYSQTADVLFNTTDESGAFQFGVRQGYLIIHGDS